MRKLTLNFGHFWIHDLMRARVTRVGPPITLIAPSLNLCHAVVPDLTPGVLVSGQVWAPPIIQQLLGGSLFIEMSLDYKHWMVLMQVEWNEGDQALLVWCVLQWQIECSTTNHYPGLPVWHWVGLVCQPSWWLLTAWIWHLTPLLPIEENGPGWASHYSFCQAGLVILNHVFHYWQLPHMRGLSSHSSIFNGGHLYFQTIPSHRPIRCWFSCWRLG